MRGKAISGVATVVVLAAALGVGPSGSTALACGYGCRGYGYYPAPVYYAPPVYGYVAPVTVYVPPAYGYAYVPGPVYGAYAPYAPAYYASFRPTRVNIFRGPRWNYSAAYYNPRSYGCRRISVCGHRHHVGGPVARAWRRR